MRCDGAQWPDIKSTEDEGEQGGAQLNPEIALGNGSGGGLRGMGGGRVVDSDSQADMLERLKEMGGDEEKIIIPIGIRMLKFNEGEGADREAAEATLNDVKIDKTISIWLDDSVVDRNLASFVLIIR